MEATASRAEMKFRSRWRWLRTVAVAFALLFVIIAVWAAVMNLFKPSGLDFLSFWAAGRLALQGRPALAYDIFAHGMMENTIAHIGGRMPFPYPPPFLTLVTFFAIPPFGVAFILWVAATAGFYAKVSSRVAPLSIAFCTAPACIDFMIGQTGFLFCGIFILGFSLIESMPFIAGAVLGCMMLKPQLALLLPVAMLAGRQWRVIAGGIGSAAILLALGLILFGLKSYEGFWNILPFYVDMLRHNKEPWNELASPFALARFAGVPQFEALAIHIIIAIAAMAITARAWWLKLDERVPIAAAATMLIPPYFFTYDALFIIIPVGWLYHRKQWFYVVAFSVSCSIVPIITYFSPWLGPNFISLAAIGCLGALHVKEVRPRCEARAATV